MAHIEKRQRPRRTGRPGGTTWRARYIAPDGRERSKSFDRKVDAAAATSAGVVRYSISNSFALIGSRLRLHATTGMPKALARGIISRRYCTGWTHEYGELSLPRCGTKRAILVEKDKMGILHIHYHIKLAIVVDILKGQGNRR